MPFDEEDQDQPQTHKIGLKQVSSQPSIFDSIPKKPTQADLDQRVKAMQERDATYKAQVAEFTVQFSKMIKDKTLRQNKNIIQKDMEKELMDEMIKFAFQVNKDPVEQEGAGSVSLILLLLRAILFQRDRINELEYSQVQIQKVIDLLGKEIKGLDIKKSSE